MLQKLRSNKEGFTLIELMIVIAIIGILAAIAIPNFVAYRNKSFCSAAESDAQAVAAAVADFFAIPSNTNLPTEAMLNNGAGVTTSNNDANPITIAGDPNVTITITVTDASTRCPADYQAGSVDWAGGTYTLQMTP